MEPTTSNICIVTNELIGPFKNGGIGTSQSHLALLLAYKGHKVAILYTGSIAKHNLEYWTSKYDGYGIDVDVIRHDQHVEPNYLSTTYHVYRHLRPLSYDTIIFQDWKASGFYPILSKQAGLAFLDTKLVVIFHSPTQWLFEANQTHISSFADLATIYMEKTSVRFADMLISPSEYMFSWAKQRNWILPKNRKFIPNFITSWDFDKEENLEKILNPLPRRSAAKNSKCSEVVFFGRLEHRKGIELFIQTINSLFYKKLLPRHITFLGKPSSHTVDEVKAALDDNLLKAHRVNFLTDYGQSQALDYLSRGSRLAVIPSLVDNSPCVVAECLINRIPFISTSTGGTAELVANADQDKILCEATTEGLTSLLASIFKNGGLPSPPKPSSSVQDTADLWIDALAVTPKKRVKDVSLTADLPFVSVIVPHRNRGHLLAHAVASLFSQDYPNFEIIIVDDESDDPTSIRILADIQEAFEVPKLTVLRQPHGYLGAARNLGVRHSQGDYVIFLDDDNFAKPHMIKTFVSTIQNTNADIVTCMMQFFHAGEGPPTPADIVNQMWGFLGPCLSIGVNENCFGDATAIYRKDAFEKLGGFHQVMGVTHEDWQLHAKAVLAGMHLATIPEPLFWYRGHENSMIRTTNNFKNNSEHIRPYKHALLADLDLWPDLLLGLEQQLRSLRENKNFLEEQVRALDAMLHK